MAFQIILFLFSLATLYAAHFYSDIFHTESCFERKRQKLIGGTWKTLPWKKPNYQWWHLLLFYLFIVWHNYFNLIFKLSRPFLRWLFSFFFSLFIHKYTIVHSYLHGCSLIMKIRVSIVIHNRSLIFPWCSLVIKILLTILIHNRSLVSPWV